MRRTIEVSGAAAPRARGITLGLLGAALLLLGCSTGGEELRPSGLAGDLSTIPGMRGELREIEFDTAHAGPSIVTVAPDQSVWVALARAGKLARVLPDGSKREYA